MINNNKNLISVLLSVVVVFSIFYFNSTPLASIDTWWHMKMGEFFLQNGSPIINDQFAIKSDKEIVATYPNLFPGIVFLKVFKNFSFLGLNLLRIGIFLAFILFLTILSNKSSNSNILYILIIILATSMAGLIILRPDLFNYIFFIMWIYLIEKIIKDPKKIKYLLLMILIELVWVNTHPLFFYYCLFVVLIYFAGVLIIETKGSIFLFKFKSKENILLFVYLFIISVIWIANPLGFKALESLYVNMIKINEINPESVRSFADSLISVNTYGYIIVFLIFIFLKPWKIKIPIQNKLLYLIIFIVLLIPGLIYLRCMPFLSIFIIYFLGKDEYSFNIKESFNSLLNIIVLIGALLLILDRTYLFSPKIVFGLNNILGTSLGESISPKGLGFLKINSQVPLREISILNKVAVDRNFVTNDLGIASCAVWFCPDKPVYWYGHAAIMNRRAKDLKEFLINFPSRNTEIVKSFLEKYKIHSVLLTNYTSRYFQYYKYINKNLTLIYIDPHISIFIRKNRMSFKQKYLLKRFYSYFLPGEQDKNKFNYQNQIYQYLLLWFSAESTGNSGDHYLNILSKYISKKEIDYFIKNSIPVLRSNISLSDITNSKFGE